jgi:hypothetical protein
VVFDQLAHAAARSSKVDHRSCSLGGGMSLEPGSAMSVVVIHALPLCWEESFRAQRCGVKVDVCIEEWQRMQIDRARLGSGIRGIGI